MYVCMYVCMEYDEDALVCDNTDITDDAQDRKDFKGKFCVISAIFMIKIFTGNKKFFRQVFLLNLFLSL